MRVTLCFLCLAMLLCASAEEGGGGTDAGAAQDELADGRYGSRREGMYKWQRNKDKVKDKALEAKARRLGISVEEARELDEQRVLADDPRKTSASKIEADYGKRSGQYAWQRNKEEVKRKAEEAKARASGSTQAADAHSENKERDVSLDEADLSGAVSVPVLLLKFDEPRSWYQKPRLCPPQTVNTGRNVDCEKPSVGMRVMALEPSDLKEKKRLRLQEEDPESYAWMEEMKGLGGAIVKLTNGKNNALVKFDSPESEDSSGPSEEHGSQYPKYEVRRKVKLTERISPFSKKQGHLAKGDVIEILETADYNGEERVRCAQGWLSARNANDRANIKPMRDRAL